MILNIFLSVIYLWLALNSVVNGQNFPGAPGPPQPQLPGRPFTQPYGSPFSPAGFNSNPQGTNPQNFPQVPDRSFPSPNSEMSQIVSELSTLLPQRIKFPIRQTNQPTTPQNPNLFNPRFTPQSPSSGYTNPQHTNPIFPNVQSPSSTFNNPQQTGPFFRPQQTNSFTPQQSRPSIPLQGIPYNPPETSSFNPLRNNPFNPPKNIPYNPPETSSFNPLRNNPFNPPKNIPYNPPETSSFNPLRNNPFNPPKNIPYNPPETSSFNPLRNNPFNPPKNIPYNPPETSSFNPLKNNPFNPPKNNPSDQTIPYNLPETIPFIPRQTNPFTFDQTNPFIPRQASPDQTIPYKPPETNPFIPRQNSPFTPDQTIPYKPPETKSFIPHQTSPTTSDQTIPYKPPGTHPFIHRRIHPFRHHPTPLLSTMPFHSSNPSNSRFQPISPGPTAPQQTSPNYARHQETIPTSSVPQKTSPDIASPQQSDSTGSQLTNSDTEGPEQTNSDLTGSQETNSDTPGLEQTKSDSPDSEQINPDIESPQQTDSASSEKTDSDTTGPQQTDSDSADSQKAEPTSDDAQPVPSASELSSSVSNAPQDTSSSATKPQDSSDPAQRPSSNKPPYRRPRLDASGDPLRGRRIVCLFNNKHYFKSSFTPSRLDPNLCTHLNYEFAILDPKTYEMIVGEPELDIDMNFYEEAIHLKHFNPELKVIISLGGWSDSTKKYSELADDPAKRENFINKAIEFIQKHGFDGLDLAWEYPNCWEGAIGVSPKDKPNFVILLKEIKKAFKPKKLIFSVSVGAIKREVDAAYDVPEVSKNVDYINVMTYDMHGPWEKKTSHHVQFEAMPGDPDPYCNVKGGMQVWIEKGANRRKLNMGLAFYGRTFRMADPNHCGMGVPAMGAGAAGPKSKEGGLLYYNEICEYLNSGNWTEKEERQAGFYACCADQFAGYDPPPMMVRKAKYVAESGLGGVLLKDLGGDDFEGKCFNMPFPLLKMVRMELMRKMMHPHARRNH